MELGSGSAASAARERFDALMPVAQSNLIAEFGQTLKGFPLTTFKKTRCELSDARADILNLVGREIQGSLGVKQEVSR